MKLKEIRRNYRGILLGVTGGIATGKTTVANMLGRFGVPIIDYDLLAREIVLPGTPAWKDIAEYFGHHILDGDGSINRPKLSEIVFSSPEKRKALEKFTHPRIHQVFVEKFSKLAASHTKSVIQVVVPLLIEANMQELFHKILVVHVSAETQLKRLQSRDAITEETAVKRLKSQMPIEKKLEYADFTIDNEDSLKESRRQAEKLWRKLNDLLNKT